MTQSLIFVIPKADLYYSREDAKGRVKQSNYFLTEYFQNAIKENILCPSINITYQEKEENKAQYDLTYYSSQLGVGVSEFIKQKIAASKYGNDLEKVMPLGGYWELIRLLSDEYKKSIQKMGGSVRVRSGDQN